MARARKAITKKAAPAKLAGYDELFSDVAGFIEEARRSAARSVNAVMTATYWLVGRRIVEQEQGGKARADYGEVLLKQLSADLAARFGRGFSRQNLQQMRLFYLKYPPEKICQTASGKFDDPAAIRQAVSGESGAVAASVMELAQAFPLPWSHYVRLLSVANEHARAFYETEALRGGWTVRQINRQIGSQFYERTALSQNKAAMLRKGGVAKAEDVVTPEEEIKSPYVLEFLGLKDEYSESDLEAGLIARLETFLLELGDDFTFVGRQRRLRVGDAWYRVDLLFFHRVLRCLVVIDLKLDEFTHADAGQMHLYLNYAREHWTRPGENPPVGLILCAKKHDAVARYALEGLPNKILAAEYRTTLPDERAIAAELEHTRRVLEQRRELPTKSPSKATGKRKRKPRT
ncbi:MAG: PDDEXK nuclease domain-containing protein [Myxococcales bacterium]|nr:PDDEXK nuclease domain-containing protein [Myxococcales bacterium]